MQKLETFDDRGFVMNIRGGAQQRFLWGTLLVAVLAALVVSMFFVDYL